MQHLSGGDLAVERLVEAECPVEVVLGEAELVAVGVEDPSVGENPRLAQPVADAANERQSTAAVVERLVESTDTDVDERTLSVKLAAHVAVVPAGSHGPAQ